MGFIVFGPVIAAAFVLSFTQVLDILMPIGAAILAVFIVVYLVRTRW